MIEAVVFDLDGILFDSEHVWDEVRQQLAEERGGRWNESASRDMMGMSSPEWSRHVYPPTVYPPARSRLSSRPLGAVVDWRASRSRSCAARSRASARRHRAARRARSTSRPPALPRPAQAPTDRPPTRQGPRSPLRPRPSKPG